MRRALLACVIAAFTCAVSARAQVKPPVVGDTTKKTTVKVTVPAPQDTIKKVKPKADSIAPLSRQRALVDWDPPDSTMSELLDRKGYRQVQYQGDKVRFDAQSKLLRLNGGPAAVKRDQTMLIGDSIVFDDSTKHIVAMGDSVTLRDPTQQKDGDDVVAAGKIDYDLGTRSGTIGAFSTSVSAGDGQPLFLTAKQGQIYADSVVSGRHIVFATNGSFTYCNLTEPHFHFSTKDMKFISDNVMVARPGILYIGEVPVFWIPFFFQDVRKGRRSGLLTPEYTVSELIRNTPGYRRQISKIGYFFAINDYMSTEFSFDWRSSARTTQGDAGFIRTNGTYTYRWLDRFIDGQLLVGRESFSNGNRNTKVTWTHKQDFSKATRLTANLNWTKNTFLHQASTINPYVQTGTIISQLNYQTKVGPASLNVGGTRRQYPGRSQVDMDFPNFNVSTAPLSAGPITWTPSLRVAVSGSQHLDNAVQFPFVYNLRTDGTTDSTKIDASRRNMNAGFETPIKIFDFVWQNSFSVTEELQDYPGSLTVTNVRNPADTVTRIFKQTFRTSVDWNTSFSLPSFLRGTWNVSPNITLANVDPQGGLLIRTERSGGRWVSQSKRLLYGLSTSPTVYAMLPGLGPVSKFRHSISPTLSYSYSPAADVSDDFLGAIGRTRQGYLGALANNRVSLGLATNLEAKLRAPTDSNPEAGKKIRLLSMQFSSLSWDFIRADTAGTGLVENNFSIAAHTDLLPGLDFRTNYSLFEGDPMSDTAVFKPFRQDVGISFSLDGKSGILALFGRLLGFHGNLENAEGAANARTAQDDVQSQQQAQNSVAGPGGRGLGMAIPSGGGWRLSLQFNGNRQRPYKGGIKILNDPATQCAATRLQYGELAYQQCLVQAQRGSPENNNTNKIGAPQVVSPPTQNIVSTLGFNITPNWSAQWATQYDAVHRSFASQQVGLQRQMHDWNATFSFMQAPNGAFSFSFFIALKAQPDLKFDYKRNTYGSSPGSF